MQIQCMNQDTESRCSGTTQRDRIEGSGRGAQDQGDTCVLVADSCWCMAKASQYHKVIILQSKQINCRKYNKNNHTIYFTAKCCEGKCAYDIAHAILGQEKAMAPHSSTLAWRIPGTEEPGGLLSMALHRVRHN